MQVFDITQTLKGVPDSMVQEPLHATPYSDHFPILKPMEEDNFKVEREEYEARFKEAQDGDNLIYPFQVMWTIL